MARRMLEESRRLTSGYHSDFKPLQTYNTVTVTKEIKLEKQLGSTFSLQYNHDATELCAGFNGGGVKLFCPQTGNYIRDLKPNRHGGVAVMCLRYHPKNVDPCLLYAATAEGQVYILDTHAEIQDSKPSVVESQEASESGMTSVEVADKSGCTLKFIEVDGKWYPRFPVDSLRNYRSHSLQNDDVILCAYPKSGTHWLWEVSMMLLKGKAQTIPIRKSLQMLEFVSTQDMESIPSPRVLNTHVLYQDLPRDVFGLKTKLIFVARNPKDVAVSMYNHHLKLDMYYQYSGTFQDWFDLFLEGKVDYGSWFDYIASWEKVIHSDVTNPIHVIMFEDMKEDPVRETTRLAEFLGVTYDPELIEEVTKKCSLSNMAKDKTPYQNLSHLIYRKGEVGDWKNTLTVAQSEAVDNALEKRLKDSKLTFRFTL